MGVLVGKNVGSSISVTATYGGKSGAVTGISVSKVDPVLFFDNDGNGQQLSSQIYDGTQKCLGFIAYTGDGTVYYQVIKATSQPSTPSASASGWVAIDGGDFIYGSASGVATGAGTYYVFLKTTGSVNYNDVSPMAAGSTTIEKANTNAPICQAGTKTTYDGNYVYATAKNGSGNPAGTIYYGTSNGSTTYNITASTTPTNLTSMGRKDVGTTNIYVFFRPTDTDNYNDSSGTTTYAKVTNKAANPLTISPTSKTIYSITSNGTGNPSGYTYHTFTITASNAQGTVTASSSNTSVATVSVSGNTITVTYKGAGTATITVNAAGNTNYAAGSKTCAVTCTLDTVSSYTDYQNPTGLTISSSVVPAGGGTSTITWSGTCKQNAKAVYASGYTDTSYTNLTIASPTKSVSGNTAVSSKGTTISNQTTAIATVTGTYSANGKSSTTTCSVLQAGNYVTAVQATSSNSGNLTAPHFSYANIGAGASSASPSLSGGAVYTFSSGDTAFANSGSPTFGGTATYTRTYSLASSQNGFTAVNSSTGVLTATPRGTTSGAARTSAAVTGVLTVKYTHASSYSAGGTVTSSTKTDTATCTQAANALTGLTMTVGNNPIAYNSTTTVTVTATYTSGASKNVSDETNTVYNDTSNPDIVQFTKS